VNSERIAASVLAATGVVVALAALLSVLARRLGQPPVIGQVLAGIALGPSVLGRLPADPSSLLVPDATLPYLGVLGQVALVLFMFSVGCELDTSLLRHQGRVVTVVSVAALAVPLVSGVAVGRLMVHVGWAPEGTPGGWAFPLFLAVALSITAMPVLASMIRDRGLAGTVPGTVATASAALTDVVGWLLLAGVIALTGPGGRAARPARLLSAGHAGGRPPRAAPDVRHPGRTARRAADRGRPAVRVGHQRARAARRVRCVSGRIADAPQPERDAGPRTGVMVGTHGRSTPARLLHHHRLVSWSSWPSSPQP
jgi:hypothetical protein